MTQGSAVSVSRELSLVATPAGVELMREGRVTESLFDVADFVSWAQSPRRSKIEKHFAYLWTQGRRVCTACNVVHHGNPHEACA